MPLRQVHIRVNSPEPISKGNQPPCGILSALAPRKTSSMAKKGAITKVATTGGQRQNFQATMNSRH